MMGIQNRNRPSFRSGQFKLISNVLVGILLLGCTSFPDRNMDPAKNNVMTFKRDVLDCAQAYPEADSGVHVRQRIGCMNLKGWR